MDWPVMMRWLLWVDAARPEATLASPAVQQGRLATDLPFSPEAREYVSGVSSLESVLEQTMTRPEPVATVNRRYQIAVENLRLQMFVVELDRPWLDTPFLLQGFLIDSKVELDTLIKYCDYVYVDLEMSSPAVADVIRRVEMRKSMFDLDSLSLEEAEEVVITTFTPDPEEEKQAAADNKAAAPATKDAAPAARASDRSGAVYDTAPRTYVPRPKARVSQHTRKRFRQLISEPGSRAGSDSESITGRLFGWFFRLFEREAPSLPKPAPLAGSDLVPAGVPLAQYEEQRAMIEELPRARNAFGRGEAALAEVMGEIRSGRAPKIEVIDAAVGSMVESMLDNPDALMWIARLREEDINTYNHGVQVALYLVALGRHLGLPKEELAHLGQIGMLADIGKMKLPRALLDKPGMLSPEEFEQVKEHVGFALQVLSEGPALPPEVTMAIAHHHERIDGSGYPAGLKGKEICLYGKMTAIADSFAALITPRAYANAWAPQEALMNLYEWSGTSFHEPMVEQFVQAIGVFPVGSMIELSTGEIGVVVAHNRIRRLEPKVLILSNTDKSPLAQPVERDLYKEGKVKGAKSLRITRGLPAGAFGFKLRDYYLDGIAKEEGIIA
jgi:HD-GYP domain-containing protein (c-di-GMP phosphodiesterase class II)